MHYCMIGGVSMIIVILLLSMITLIYFLSMVCIQYSYMNNISLQFGMDVTKLYCDEDDTNILHKTNYYVRECAMILYKISHNKYK